MPHSVPRFVLALAVLASARALSQAPAPLPVYDAVAIKPSKAGTGNTNVNTRNDTFQAENVPLKQLLVIAFGIREGLISGLPPWAESARYDINAKIVDYDPAVMKQLTRDQRRAILAAMLVERFHLKTHIEVRTLPVYELVVAGGAPKIKFNPPPTPEPAAPAQPASDQDPPKPGTTRGSDSVNNNNGRAEIKATAVPLTTLARDLSAMLDRTVLDKTNLPGEFDYHLTFTSESAPQPQPDDAPPLLFTALQEQLGLKLQPGKGPVDTLIIDHIDPPSEN